MTQKRDDNPSGAAGAVASITITTTALPNGTVGSGYSQQLTLTATGGQSPYTWSVVSGSLPAGLSLSTSGVISGIPTVAATSSFTVRVTDANSVTDDQALTLTVIPCLPGGCGITVTGVANTDTHIISGSGVDTNYGTSTTMEVYQWPPATVANRIILVNSSDISALPDNISITSATLRLFATGYEGGGGTNPMRVHAKSISGTLPNPATVTWNTFAGTLSSDLAVTDVTLTSTWFEWNVTSYVAAQYANSKAAVYIALDGGPDGASDTNRIFASVNNATSANRPQLVIVYTQLVGPPGPSISAPGKMRVVHFKGRAQ